jgi:hypothetical protein
MLRWTTSSSTTQTYPSSRRKMPPRKLNTNAFGLGELREEVEEAENEGLALKDIPEEIETQELLSVDERPVFRLLREKEEWVDKGLEKAYADGYTEILTLSYDKPFFYVLTKREVKLPLAARVLRNYET